MSMTKPEMEKALKRRLTKALEGRNLFVKFSQDGTVTVLKGNPGEEKEILVTGISLMECGERFQVWGASNPRQTHAEKMNPDRSPPDFKLPTPEAAAAREAKKPPLPKAPTPKTNSDSIQEDKKNMSEKKSKARQRAERLITDYRLQDGAFANVFNGSTSSPAEDHSSAPAKTGKATGDRGRFEQYMDDNLRHVPADDARARMIQRQQTHTPQNTSRYLKQISRERWQSNSEGSPGSSISPYRKEKT